VGVKIGTLATGLLNVVPDGASSATLSNVRPSAGTLPQTESRTARESLGSITFVPIKKQYYLVYQRERRHN
jgi:hypothetical protein